MNPILYSKLRMLGEFCFITSIAGIIYQLLNDKIVNHMAIIVGISLGLAFGIIELFILAGLQKRFLRFPFIVSVVLKSIIYLLLIYIVSGTIGLVDGVIKGKQMEEFYAAILSKTQLILAVYTLMIFILLSFYIQINLLLGEGVLFKFLFGKYRNPTGEHRIFMFLDLKSSTSLAERLGLKKYYSLLNDFFHEISEPVQRANAEIYQYVGDEVILTWKTRQGVDRSNCLKIFFQIQEKVYRNRKYYREKYGDVPAFKAGLHYGEVITAQIGDIKREIIYNGDVLNTCARIQEQCNKLHRELLISGNLLKELDIENEYKAEKIDTVTLRGKETKIELYSLIQF